MINHSIESATLSASAACCAFSTVALCRLLDGSGNGVSQVIPCPRRQESWTTSGNVNMPLPPL